MMRVLDYEKKRIEVDEEGYLVRFNDWDEDVAQALAAQAGIGNLTPDKINMLTFIREYYKNYNFFPIVHSICKSLHESGDCVHEKFINPLVAWRVAGLPHPEEPVVSLLEAGQSPG